MCVDHDQQLPYEESQLYKVRHSVAHIMAQAVLEMFPEARIAIGPPIKDGFYYDFELPRALTEDDLAVIEKRTRQIARELHSFECKEVSAEELKTIFKDQPYKLELIDDIIKRNADEYGNPLMPDQKPRLTTYQHSTFRDLCRGPHVATTKEINAEAIKLLRVAGAYWRGDEKRPMLQRIYGTAFESPKELDEYLHRIEEAKKRDHRNIGKKLDLFSHSEEVGPGLVLWHPKGALVRYAADRFSQDAHMLNGYEWVFTPHIGKSTLWETSGHLNFYKDSMYSPIDIEGDLYYLKPMNCPFHIQIYKSQPRTYRELPKRFAEFGTVYRYERSGTLSGLTRVRGFTQDDAHIFCLPEQVESEISHALRFSLYVLRTFGLEKFKAYISTKPEKAVGADADWELATSTLKRAIEAEGIPYDIDEGGGAFYGPKIDLKLLDSLDREWQLSTVQFDFNLPERFKLEYVGSDGQTHRPFMVHRALFGSAERFFAMLVEHYAGEFPLWLAPVQATLIPISDRHLEYARKVEETLKGAGLRVHVDDRSERMQAKIRDSEMEKVPFAIIMGDRDAAAGTISVRSRTEGDKGGMTPEAFLQMTEAERAKGRAVRIPR